jgi:hypothetical protein
MMSDEPKIRNLIAEMKEAAEELGRVRKKYLRSTEGSVSDIVNAAKEVARVEENSRILMMVAKLISGWSLNVQMTKNEEMGEEATWVAEEAFRLTCDLRDAIVNEDKKFEQPDMHMRPFQKPEQKPEPDNDVAAIGEDENCCHSSNDGENEPELSVNIPEATWPPIAVNIVKLMVKAGTKKDGMSAVWSAEEIEHGLKEVHPEIDIELVEQQLEALMSVEVVVKSRLGNTSDHVYCVADNGLEEMDIEVGGPEEKEPGKKEALAKTIGELLLTNKDEEGKLLPWTLNQLLFAARDSHRMISMTDEDIREAADECPVCVEINNCQYPTFIHRDATFEQQPLTPLMKELHGLMLRDLGGKRMWRDYDIYSILNRIGSLPDDHNEAVKYMNGILQRLIDAGLVRYIPYATDHRFKEDRWKALLPPEEEEPTEGVEQC